MERKGPKLGRVAILLLGLLQGDALFAEYFRAEAAKLRDGCLDGITTLEAWEAKRGEYRRQLFEMLGLDPQPERTDLKVTVTERTDHPEFVVERLHYQSAPGLYVTGNLYVPKKREGRLPAILYLCGHGAVKKGDVSFGNKVHYQHHGAWFARNGYVCLTIDSLQLGEIEGVHHGTYRQGMWWWLNRGYTPAGVEAWNCIRALDLLQARGEVDPGRLGVTGRSGGGAYSWWIAALDERIKVAVPVAGITDLVNHVDDPGVVEGHCDCMFFSNTYRWDYPLVAALVAPRPLLISNTDRDGIFPLEGVVRTHEKVRRIYRLYKAEDKLALQITAGPHKDTQELHLHAFRWFNQHLRKDDAPIEKAAVKFFEPEQLRVFAALPADQRNTRIQEEWVAAASPTLPADRAAWQAMRDGWMKQLAAKTFAGWPAKAEPLNVRPVGEGVYEFTSQSPFRLRLTVKGEVLRVGSPDGVEPRGTGPTAWDASEKKQVQHRRRFYLLGQTLEGMQVYDVRRAIQALREIRPGPVVLEARGAMAGVALYAALFEPGVELRLTDLPASHREGPYFLNVSRVLDLPQAVALAAERAPVTVSGKGNWDYPAAVARMVGASFQSR